MAYKGMSNYEIADQLGVDESRIRAAFRAEGFDRKLLPSVLDDYFKVDLDTPITVGHDAMITADWHIPLFDLDYTNVMLAKANELDLRTLIVAGDFWNMDALSDYQPKQKDANLEKELESGLDIMRTVLRTFDRVIYIWGNHDARLHKALGLKLQFKQAMQLVFNGLEKDEASRLEFSNLDHVWLEVGDDRYYICHPATYSRVPLTAGRVLATKYNAHVITAHSHHCAVGYAINGKDVVAEIGGLFDRHKTAYLQRSTSFPTWAQGFAWTEGGKLRVHSPGWSLV